MVTVNLGNGKWLAAVLFASLAANVFLGGVLAGRLFSSELSGPVAAGATGDQRPVRRFIATLTAALDDNERETFLTAVAARGDAMRRAGREVKLARREALARMHATPFDRKALDDALATLRQKQQALQLELQTAVADAVEKLPDEARKRVGVPKHRLREGRP